MQINGLTSKLAQVNIKYNPTLKYKNSTWKTKHFNDNVTYEIILNDSIILIN